MTYGYNCANCHKPIKPTEPLHFYPHGDFIVCADCLRSMGLMLSVEDVKRITNDYGKADIIPITDTDYLEKTAGWSYNLIWPSAFGKNVTFHVKGLSWGHGDLFVFTEEHGTTGIHYPHEIDPNDLTYEDEDGNVYDEPVPAYHQKTLLDWGVSL